MEKGTPHRKLSTVKALIQVGQVRATVSALSGAAALGLDFDGIIGVIMALTPRDFYKSMTTCADHRAWRDGYRPTTVVGEVYLKLMVVDDVLIVSIKEP